VFLGVLWVSQQQGSPQQQQHKLWVHPFSTRRNNRQQNHRYYYYYNNKNNNNGTPSQQPHISTVAMDDALRQDIPSLTCPYTSLDDLLTTDERVSSSLSSKQGKQTLVCCTTTAGPWNILIHHHWAPHGARRFLDMVSSSYFSAKVPLMRCIENWMCQFGLAGWISETWKHKIPDDPQWLKAATTAAAATATAAAAAANNNNNNNNIHFQTGFLAFAGSGPNTRGRQLFVALSDQNQLGKQPWEVPFGETIGKHSFATLQRIYKDYGEDGPDQNRMIEEGAHDYAMREFPNLDYILSCQIVDETE
jgi:cyclophilin family peptidyl-prolyl cis-trans isomerase